MAGQGQGVGGLGGMGGMPNTRQEMGGDAKTMLNTCIHNYFVAEGHHDLAKALLNSKLAVNQDKLKKEGNNQVNGVSPGSDTKDDRIRAVGADGSDNHLLDYWFIFWDMWNASKTKEHNTPAGQYLMRQGRPMAPNGLVPGAVGNYNQQFRAMPPNFNGAGNNIARQAQMNQLTGQAQRRGIGQQPMKRDGSGMELNGDTRPGSPGSAGDGPSPKRQRTEGPFNDQMGGPGRPALGSQLPNGAIANQEALMLQRGLNPNTAQYQQAMKNHQQQQAAYQSMANGGGQWPGAQSGSPMIAADQNTLDLMSMPQQIRMGQQPVGAQNGAALQDYQMQLMLLEQQNKKRLMMARQEAENPPNSMVPGGFPPGADPHGRHGQSPAPGDMKMSPRMGQGSPQPNGMPRSSPAPGNFEHMAMGPTFMPQMNKMMGEGSLIQNGAMMRGPPGAHAMNSQVQMDMMRRQQQMNPAWAAGLMPGQMMPPAPGAQPPNQADNGPQQQRGNMPPPQAPPSGANKVQSSPVPGNAAAPPTPSTSAKKADKAKKENKESKKKTPKTKAPNANSAPSVEGDKQSTPPPPSTPVHADAHIIKGRENAQNNQAQQLNTQNQTVQQNNNGQPQPNGIQQPMNNDAPFGNFGESNGFMDSMDGFPEFTNSGLSDGNGMDSILEGFDFGAFIEDGNSDWPDTGINFDEGLPAETGQ